MTGLNPSWYWPRHLLMVSNSIRGSLGLSFLSLSCTPFRLCSLLHTAGTPTTKILIFTGRLGPGMAPLCLAGSLLIGWHAFEILTTWLGTVVTNWRAALPNGVCSRAGAASGRPRNHGYLLACRGFFATFNNGFLLFVLQSALCIFSSDLKQRSSKICSQWSRILQCAEGS